MVLVYITILLNASFKELNGAFLIQNTNTDTSTITLTVTAVTPSITDLYRYLLFSVTDVLRFTGS